jgi:hypothetical protein
MNYTWLLSWVLIKKNINRGHLILKEYWKINLHYAGPSRFFVVFNSPFYDITKVTNVLKSQPHKNIYGSMVWAIINVILKRSLLINDNNLLHDTKLNK